MKKSIILLLLVAFLSGCATYRASALSNLSAECVLQKPASSNLSIGAKAFTKQDCRKYLDRDLLSKGYQPVQLYIENLSDNSYIFSTSRISLPLASAEEVADKVHTSLVGRIAGYGAAALVFTPLFAIPAAVDGFKSCKANEALDSDFSKKSAKNQIIAPYSEINMLLFVPLHSYQNTFSLTLMEEGTNRPVKTFVYIQ